MKTKNKFFFVALLTAVVLSSCKNEELLKEPIVDVAGVNLNQTELTLEIDEEFLLIATVIPENATEKNVIWSSDDEDIATVADGKVTAKAAGKTSIIAEVGDKRTTCKVTVKSFEPDYEHGFYDTGLPRRVFGPNSFWYKRLPADAPLDPQSEAKRQFIIQKGIEHWGNANMGFPSWALNNYNNTPSIIVVDNNTPLANITTGMTLRETVIAPYFNNLREMFSTTRLPADAKVESGGTDRFLIVYNKDTDEYFDFWVVHKDYSGWPGWSAQRGHRIENASTKSGIAEPYGDPETPFYYGSNAAGLAEEGGVIKAQELVEGHIKHVLNIVLPIACVADKNTVGISAPAVRSDGASLEPHAVMMGQRLRLPASLDLNTYNFHPVTKAVARAFQEYGAIVMDRGGDISFRGENRSDLPNGTAIWNSIFAGAEPHNVMWNYGGYDPFPWEHLQVLEPNYMVP